MPGIFPSKSPLDGNLITVHAPVPGSSFFPQGLSISHPPLAQALPGKQADGDLSLIQPTAVLGRVMYGEPSPQPSAFFFAKTIYQGFTGVGVQVIHHYDEDGNRFTPSHAVKGGKRYRYYVSQAAIHHRSTAQAGPIRIPAQEIEGVVCRRLQSLLSSSQQLLEAIGVPSEDAATSKALIIAGKQIAKAWPAKAPTELREFLSSVVGRIVVHETSLEMAIIQPALRETLLGNLSVRVTKQESLVQKGGKRDVFKLTIDSRVKRCGGEVRLLVPTDSATEAPARPVPSLIKAVARAHQWPEQIIQGELEGRRSIARLTGLDERYAGRILDCAFLAPDIVEAILDGRQPADLGIQKLLRDLPVMWVEQRKRLGFPTDN